MMRPTERMCSLCGRSSSPRKGGLSAFTIRAQRGYFHIPCAAKAQKTPLVKWKGPFKDNRKMPDVRLGFDGFSSGGSS